MTKQTPQETLAHIKLDQALPDWVAERRGEGLSWDAISRQLDSDTDGAVIYTGETLRTKYGQ